MLIKSCTTKISLLRGIGMSANCSNSMNTSFNSEVSEASAAKKKFRPIAKSRIKSLSTEEKIRQTKEVTRILLEDPLYVSARTISIYLHMADEVGTRKILENSLKSYKKCFVPQYFTHPKPRMSMVELFDMDDYESLPSTKWNIKQPLPNEANREVAKDIDLVIVPGLAFTPQGKRLGRGMGFYDRFLSKLRRRPNTVALAFDVQVFEDLPTDRDFQVDKVLFCGSGTEKTTC